MEIWDGYNADGTLAGVDLLRGEPIPPEIYHLICGVLVRHKDGSYLLMRRHPEKAWGGLWEASAGGHALKGEGPAACIRRELYEETGLRGEHFRLLNLRLVQGNGFFCSFLCETGEPKDSVRLQEGETTDFRWLDEAQFRDFIRDGMIEGQKLRYAEYFRELGYI